MRRSRSPNVTFLAATSSMSSRPLHRGRGRGFSDRPYSGGRGNFVSGDAHLRSVRDANLGLRRGQTGSFPDQSPHHRNPPSPPQPHHPRPQFRHPPPPNFLPHSPQFQPQFRPPQLSDHRPAFRPSQHLRSRPADYRDWEPALTPPPPPHCERFKVLSYNILADYLALDHRSKLYFHIPRHILDWQWRKRSLLFELRLWSADILCLQEVDRFHELAEELSAKGYSGTWKMRTGNPVDGCAIFWQKSRFNLLYEECIEFNKLGLRDNVAQLCVLEFINRNGSLPSRSTGSSKVVVFNIHVLYNPNRGEIKLGQVRVLLDKAKAVSKLWNDAPLVICGDFNCTPKSPLYNFISEQKLDLSGIARNKVSGQASAIIQSSKLYYGPNSSEISANGSVQATSTEGDKEVIKQNSSQSDMRNLVTKCHSLDNQISQTVLDLSVKSCANVECRKEKDTFAGKDTHETNIDHSEIFCEVGSLKEPDHSYNESRLHVNPDNGEIRDITPVTSSAPEAVNSDSDKTGMGSNKHVLDVVPTSNKELSKKFNLDVPEGNKHVEFDCSPTSPQEDSQSSMVRTDLESIDLDNVEISSTKPFSQTSVSNAFEVPCKECGGSPSHEEIANDQNNSSSTLYLADKSHQLSNINFPLDEEKSFFDEIDKTIIGGEIIGEDDSNFISALHNAEGVTLDLSPSMKSDLEKSYKFEELTSASNNLIPPKESNEVGDDLSPSHISKSLDAEATYYDPALWTPIEIETATGNSECTFLEHPIQLRSTYTETMDCSGTRDSHGEPLVTSYNRRFSGTVDYIWRSEGLQTTRVLAPMSKQAIEWTPGFPTKKWGSDHIALVTELAFLKDVTDISPDVN